MAKEREIERWVTINGSRVPIYKDGGVGFSTKSSSKPNYSIEVVGDKYHLKYNNQTRVFKDEKYARDFITKDMASLGLDTDKDKFEAELERAKKAMSKTDKPKEQINKDNDTKEKQIAENRKKADELNKHDKQSSSAHTRKETRGFNDRDKSFEKLGDGDIVHYDSSGAPHDPFKQNGLVAVVDRMSEHLDKGDMIKIKSGKYETNILVTDVRSSGSRYYTAYYPEYDKSGEKRTRKLKNKESESWRNITDGAAWLDFTDSNYSLTVIKNKHKN